MSIENATVTGWRPATRQDLIDLIDGGEPQEARFRDHLHGLWRVGRLIGSLCGDLGIRYSQECAGAWQELWRHCEIKTQALRDPKFSDLDNGPIECMIYPDGGYERPQKGILVGMRHHPTNKRNTTGMEYTTKWLHQKDDPNASVSFRWNVKVVDKSPEPEQEKEHEVSVKLGSMIDANGVVGVAIVDSEPVSDKPEQTSTGWRTPTIEDLKDGPIECEVRDCDEDEWTSAILQNIGFELEYPHRCREFNWKYCRIKVTEPVPQARFRRLGSARFREVDTGDEGKQVEFLDERTGEFVAGVLARFVNRSGFMLPVDYEGVVHMYARIHR
jgi:hypothetical protein